MIVASLPKHAKLRVRNLGSGKGILAFKKHDSRTLAAKPHPSHGRILPQKPPLGNYLEMTQGIDSRTLKNLTRVIVSAIVISAFFLAREVLVPFALALVFAFLLTPVVSWLERRHLGRIPSVIVVMVIFAGAVGTTAWFVGTELIAVVNQLPAYRANIHQKVEALHKKHSGSLRKAANTVEELNKELSPSASSSTYAPQVTTPVPVVVEAPSDALTEARSILGPLIAPLVTALIVLVFIIFMLSKREDLRNRLLRLAGRGRLNIMTQAMDEAASRISRYLLLQLAVNVLYGLVFAVGLFFIGVPYPMLWGVLATLLRFIPYVGTLIAAAMPTGVALAVSSGWIPAFLVLGLFVILEFVVGNFVEPLLYASHTGVSALALLISAVFWTLLWGTIGLILATPLTVCLLVLARFVPALSFLTIILGDEEVLPPEALFYQRLLALDQEEAQDIADKFLAEKSLAQLYDNVIVPSLSMAELDRHQDALDEKREEFILQSTREMVEEWGTEITGTRSLDREKRLSPVKILCLPASDQADGITALMLEQMLEASGLGSEHLAPGTLVGEMIQAISRDGTSIVCICALPPFAISHARGVCKRLHASLPDLKIVVGIWGGQDAEKKTEDRMKMAGRKSV